MFRTSAFHCIGALSLAATLCGTSFGQATTRVSLSAGNTQGNFHSLWGAVSADGRYAAFQSTASNLVIGDLNGHLPDVFVRDLLTPTTLMVSVDSSGGAANGGSIAPSMSADGRYVAFESDASNLVAGDSNGMRDIFVHDLSTGVTERVSVDSNGFEANGPSYFASISADGRWVAFESDATNLVPAERNSVRDVFVHDRQTGQTKRASVNVSGGIGNAASTWPSISGDGRYVAFMSDATNLVANDVNGFTDVFVKDMVSGVVLLATADTSGVQGNAASMSPSISSDGRVVAFASDASNLVALDTNGATDVFARDLVSGVTARISVDSAGSQANSVSLAQGNAQVSSDGRFVAFDSMASNLVAGDTNGGSDCFVHDRLTGSTLRVSVTTAGAPAGGGSRAPAISPDGRFIVFESSATNLVPGDNNNFWDVFLRDRGAASAFTASCFGDGTTAICPCNNNGMPGHGCDNSIGTGGALLQAAGTAMLASDTVQFTSSGELPSALSIVLQGNVLFAPVNFGDGLRCIGGNLKRLYTKNASGGAMNAPVLGDPSVSARSTALGDPIPLGASRLYQVYYRDPSTTFCPEPLGYTFNVSNAVFVAWGA
jgi:Tol biopolymer transport system component